MARMTTMQRVALARATTGAGDRVADARRRMTVLSWPWYRHVVLEAIIVCFLAAHVS
jgi:hypothetical protein